MGPPLRELYFVVFLAAAVSWHLFVCAQLAANYTADKVSWTAVTDEAVINETTDCAAFRRRRGFIEIIDPETADFPLAYNILAHTRANQLV